MDQITQRFFTDPPALADPDARIDPFSTIEADPDRQGGILVTTAGGRRLLGTISEPAPGVVRVRLGPAEHGLVTTSSAMLEPLDDRPLPVRADGDGIAVGLGDRSFTWTRSAGMDFGPLRSAGRAHSVLGPHAGSGLLIDRVGDPRGSIYCFEIGPHDAIFGGGESFQGPDLRGRMRRGVNVEAMLTSGLDFSYLNVPFYWSDAGWGVFAHTAAPVRADLGCTHNQVLGLELPSPSADLFFYLGAAPDLIRSHQAVTGLPGGMPPWALGVWTSRCSYLSADEIGDVLDGYTAAGCPVDVVHVDAWQVGNLCRDLATAWEVDRLRFPTGWANAIADRGVRVSLWHNPYLIRGSAVANEAAELGLLMRDDAGELVTTNDLGHRLLIDFTNPAAQEWWDHRVEELIRSEGAEALKPDFAEEVPPAARLADGRSGWDARNEYALLYQARSHACLSRVLGSNDVALFCRSGTAGSQRYPTHWVGDTPSTWAGMAAALRACLSLSLSGFGFVASDVGGFWAPPRPMENAAAAIDNNDPSLFEADVDPELFVRWSQWGALSPVMRFHGTGRREPWAYPEPFATAAVAACRLRSDLHPYLSSVAATATATGAPMMRPMALAYPGDRGARHAELQYLLGDEVLVAPVLGPGGGVRLWVPPGRWDGLRGAPGLQGPGWTTLELDLDVTPAGVPEGWRL